MDAPKLAENLWLTANVITGFAAIQVFTFSYAVFDNKIPGLDSSVAKSVLFAMILLGYIIYSYGAWWCGNKSIKVVQGLPTPMNEENIKLMRTVNYGRLITVVFFGVCALVIVFWQDVIRT